MTTSLTPFVSHAITPPARLAVPAVVTVLVSVAVDMVVFRDTPPPEPLIEPDAAGGRVAVCRPEVVVEAELDRRPDPEVVAVAVLPPPIMGIGTITGTVAPLGAVLRLSKSGKSPKGRKEVMGLRV